MNVLAIGCHPDDIEISCAGTLAKCVKRGDKVLACHVANGNMGRASLRLFRLRSGLAAARSRRGSDCHQQSFTPAPPLRYPTTAKGDRFFTDTNLLH